MTILFPGRKLDQDLASLSNPRFRDDVIKCIASRIDKRHIVHDYAASQDNVVFVPTQDEDVWANEMDWSGFVTLKLYTPDLQHDGMTTNNAILQSVWQMNQDGSLKAVSLGNKPTKQRLPLAVTSLNKFGLVVDEAADTVAQTPSTGMRTKSDSFFPMYDPPGGPVDFGQRAREQYYSHSRRMASEPILPAGYKASRSSRAPRLPPRPTQQEEEMLAPYEPVYQPPPPPRPHLMSDAAHGTYGPPVGGFIPPQLSGHHPPPAWDFHQSPMEEIPPNMLAPRPTVLRRRSGGSGRRRSSGTTVPGPNMSEIRSGDQRVVRRKLSRRRSGSEVLRPNGEMPFRAPNPMPIPPMQQGARHRGDEMGCGCVIC